MISTSLLVQVSILPMPVLWSTCRMHNSSIIFVKLKTFVFNFYSGSHLLSHAVSSIVSSAAYVLTNVFGMRTGVSHKRIATRHILVVLTTKQQSNPYSFP